MRVVLSLILFIVLVPAFTSGTAAQSEAAQGAADQGTSSAAQNVADLQLRLLDVQAREAELQARARQLDEAVKPENIERSLAGVGSTRPEELREQRRRELTIERDGVRAQLKLLTTSRERLELVIRTAEAHAYQQSAQQTTFNQTLMAPFVGIPRWMVAALAGLIAILGIGFVVVLMRRARTT